MTCTKLINYHAIEDSVIVMDKGSIISTKTIAYDAETGNAIITKTANEFNDPIYNTNYPAYWAYSGMSLAYKNIDRQFTGATFSNGNLIYPSVDMNIFESGDELYIIKGETPYGCIPSPNVNKIWAFDKNKNNTSLTVPEKDIIFIDSAGNVYNKANVSFRIIRSGKRNNLNLTVSTVSSMQNPIRTISGIRKLLPDATTNVVNASAIDYKEKWQVDEDVFLRREYYSGPCYSTIELDSLSCNGILEKNINPYLKGLIGTFRPYRNYIYYGSRNETAPNSTTQIRNGGYINGFSNYWEFNTDSNLVPDLSNAKWVWNSEITKINSKGQELETHDALNRYTAAQFGFAKNLPVAVTQNARYGQSMSESFEDVFYEERIYQSNADSCSKRYIDFSGLPNCSVDSNYAHSGKNSLKINANSEAIQPLNLINFFYDDFHFEYINGEIKSFSSGSTSSILLDTITPNQDASFNIPYTLGNLEAQVGQVSYLYPHPILINNGSNSDFYARYAINQFVKITTDSTYSFTLYCHQGYDDLPTTPEPLFNRGAIQLFINKLDGTNIFEEQLYSDGGSIPHPTSGSEYQTYNVYLPCGIYEIKTFVSFDNRMTGLNFISHHHFDALASYTSNVHGVLGSVVACTYAKPIPGKDSMLNPMTFALNTEKKMQFSAWVKESCDTPCYKVDFNKSSIQLKCNGTVTGNLKRTGTIIEGWQKIEGDFTVPSGTTSTELIFTNSNSAPMFVDDIRIHPFNSNMKSYVYDTRTLRLSAELDENNYTSFYEYDEEGQLVRVKKETTRGIKTIKESRSAKQKGISDIQ